MTTEEFIESIKLEGEEWRDVVGYEDYYMVSNFGRIININTIIEDKLRNRTKKQTLLKTRIDNRNSKYYYTVRLYKNKNSNIKYVHRLIAEAFIPNPECLPEIDHIDRNGLNNNINNLRWCNHKDNQNNINTKKAMSVSHINVPQPKRWKPVVQLQNNVLVKIYPRMLDAESDGFSHVAILHVIKGKSKHHKGFHWMYLEDYNTLINKSKNPLSNTSDYPQYEPPLNP